MYDVRRRADVLVMVRYLHEHLIACIYMEAALCQYVRVRTRMEYVTKQWPARSAKISFRGKRPRARLHASTNEQGEKRRLWGC